MTHKTQFFNLGDTSEKPGDPNAVSNNNENSKEIHIGGDCNIFSDLSRYSIAGTVIPGLPPGFKPGITALLKHLKIMSLVLMTRGVSTSFGTDTWNGYRKQNQNGE